MTKPVITTRATKGSALTWTEGDTNLENLRDATITVKADTGGTDVVSDLNGTVTLVAGTNVTITGDNTAKTVTIAASGGSTSPAGSNQQIQFNNSGVFGASSSLYYDGVSLKVTSGNIESLYSNGDEGGEFRLATAQTNNTLSGGSVVIDINQNQLRFFESGGSNRGAYINLTEAATGVGTNLLASGGLAHIVEDTTPQLGGNLDVQANIITTSTTNGNITITPDGTGDVILSTDSVQIGESTNQAVLTTSGGDLRLNTNNGTNSGFIRIASGANNTITISPNGTGRTTVSALTYNEGAIYDLGTTGGTIAPNLAFGNVQKITLNAALTMNGFTSPTAGQSLTLIIYGGTSYTSITSTMKFAGGDKTLTGTAGCIDILSVYYDGTTYFASLGKGFA